MRRPRHSARHLGLRKPRPGFRPALFRLEEKALLSGIVATGSPPGSPPVVHVYDATTGAPVRTFEPFPAGYRGGVQVAVADVSGDGTPDVIAIDGPGSRAFVEVFSGADGSLLGAFAAGPANYRGGFSIAAADITGDGRADIVLGALHGSPWVNVFRGPDGTPVASFLAGSPKDRGGVRVAAGDLSGDGRAEIAAVNASGVPEVRIFDGVTFARDADYRASFYAPRGGATIAVGSVLGGGSPDVVLAQASPRGLPTAAEVAVFPGLSSVPILSRSVPGAGFARGVQVATVANAGGGDSIVLSPSAGGTATVLDLTPTSTATVVNRIDVGRTGSLAAGSTLGTTATPPVSTSTLTPLQRLARWNGSEFVPVKADDPNLVGKNVDVIVHGWAPGYLGWVQKDASEYGQTLTWWATFPGQPGYHADLSTGTPASAFLLDGLTSPIDGFVASSTGLTQALTGSDPNAVVLAYSWIDQSATAGLFSQDFEAAAGAEGLTELNGERLATALDQALGGSSFTGQLQIIGHSFGSKVATVAAGALEQASPAIPVRQLTILDSPEAPKTYKGDGIDTFGAANYNWYFLQDVNVNRSSPTGTFVDNYISEAGQPYSNVAYAPPGLNLKNVVDVQLSPWPFSLDVGDEHSYAADWYAGSGVTGYQPGQNYGNVGGRLWSPLLAGNSGPSRPPASLAQGYQQSWHFYDPFEAYQYGLTSWTPTALAPKFNPIAFTSPAGTGVTVVNGSPGSSVALAQGGTSVSYVGTFTTANSYLIGPGIRGITFSYAFPSWQPGDLLTIAIDGTTEFTMDPSVMLNPSGQGLGTISLADPWGDVNHTLTFTLTSKPGDTTSDVVVSNIQQFSY